MRISTIRWLIAITVALVVVACAKDEGPVPVSKPIVVPTDTTGTIDTAIFSTEVETIFQAKCWLCHPPYGGLDLTVSDAYGNLVNVPSTNHAPAIRVVPGDLDGSVLWHKVTGDGLYGTMMPPPGYPQLTMEELQTIRDWIEQGALDN